MKSVRAGPPNITPSRKFQSPSGAMQAQAAGASPQRTDRMSVVQGTGVNDENEKLRALRLVQKKHMLAGIRKRNTIGVGHGFPFVEDELIERASEETIKHIFNQTMPHLNGRLAKAGGGTPYCQDSLTSHRPSPKSPRAPSTHLSSTYNPQTSQQVDDDQADEDPDQSTEQFQQKVPSPNQRFQAKSKQ